MGYKLTSDARIFGGNALTVSDIAVAGGLCNFGDKEKVQNLDKDLVEKALRKIRQMTESALDQVKVCSISSVFCSKTVSHLSHSKCRAKTCEIKTQIVEQKY